MTAKNMKKHWKNIRFDECFEAFPKWERINLTNKHRIWVLLLSYFSTIMPFVIKSSIKETLKSFESINNVLSWLLPT